MRKIAILLLLSILTVYIGVSQENEDIFNVYFKQDFEDDTPGQYDHDEWYEDWNHPNWEIRLDETEIVNSTDPDQPSKVMHWVYPEGAWCTGPDDGGGGNWHTPLNHSFNELYFSYRMKINDGFQPVVSGKLPGFYGGPQWPVDTPPEYDEGYAFHFSWNYYPDLVVYIYHQDQPGSSGDPFPIGCGIPTDKWVTMSFRVVMNTVEGGRGNKDGIFETFIDGKLVHQIDNLRFRNNESIGTDYLMIESFFGGSSEVCAAARNEWIQFDDFVAFDFKENSDVPRGNTPSAADRILQIPKLNITVIDPPDPDEDTINPPPPSFDQCINVGASGSEIAGENAKFKLFVNNEEIGETLVNSTDSKYTMCTDMEIRTDDTIAIRYVNDYSDSNGDRNLYISYIEINGNYYYPSDKNVVFLYDNDVLDGMDIRYGSYLMDLPGNLIFYLGEEEVNLSDVYPSDRDDNDNPNTNHAPEIVNQVFTVQADENPTLSIGNIRASDEDEDQTIAYHIKSGNIDNLFSLDEQTGILSFNCSNKNPDTLVYQLGISVTDNADQPVSSDAKVTVTVLPFLQIIYIDPSAQNTFKDGSKEYPYKSWKEVEWKPDFMYLQKKGTVAVEGKINIAAENIILGSYGDGELPLINSTASDFALRVFEKSNVTINDMHIVANNAISCIYFMGGNSVNNKVENCILEGANNGVRIIDGLNYTINYTTIKGTSEAIYSFATENHIYYNVFKDNITAINISSYVATADIFNNVFYGNVSGVYTTYAELTLYNNIFYLVNPGDMAINHNMDKLISDNNIFYPEFQGFVKVNNKEYNSIAQLQSELKIDLNSFSNDPNFIDILNDNFMVNIESPVIDAGKDVGIKSDFYGNPVPCGNKTDIGLTEQSINGPVTSDPDIEKDINKEATIYPNPSDGRFNIFTNLTVNPLQQVELMITDMLGKLIYQSYLNVSDYQETSIDISNYPKGLYLVHLISDVTHITKQVVIK